MRVVSILIIIIPNNNNSTIIKYKAYQHNIIENNTISIHFIII